MKPMNKYLKSVLIIVGALVLAVLVWYGFLAGLEKYRGVVSGSSIS